jgi:ribonuclease HII
MTQLSLTVTAEPAAADLAAAIGGVDEAGRGPLAGPVVAAAVVLAPGQRIDGVRDSKQLSPRQREARAAAIRSEAVGWAVARADVTEIDELNILHASLLAMRRAVDAVARRLGGAPGRLRIDGNRAPALMRCAGVVETVVGGDRSCPAIAAASILAKVSRDRIMCRLDNRYPEYGFARHKGYPTAMHRDALLRFGPCPEHRRSFRPVRLAMQARGGGR